MAKTFATMKTNVGNMAGPDTSTSFATLIGVWLNDKYKDISKKALWSGLIKFDYTDLTEVGIATYDLPADFDEELFVADITDGAYLVRYNENTWWAERATAYGGGTISRGTANRYIILRSDNHLFLDPTPSAIHTIAMPYKKIITDLTGTGSPVISDIEYIMELGALAEAMAYKKQFSKATYYLQRYEYELGKRVAQERSAINQLYQMKGQNWGGESIRPMTGWGSYESL